MENFPEAEDSANEAQKQLVKRCNTWPKIFNFFQGAIQQKLKAYQNTPEKQVILSMLKLLKKNLSEKERLEIANELTFLDEEGIPIVFNVEALPNEIKLFVLFPEAAFKSEEQ